MTVKEWLQDFQVKYLGMKPARGLWGIKHTRKPVDDLVGLARGLGPGAPLPYLQLSVSGRGVVLTSGKTNTCPTPDTGLYPIGTHTFIRCSLKSGIMQKTKFKG